MIKDISESVLEAWLENVRSYAHDGQVANYIPALSRSNPEDLAVAIHYLDGDTVEAGKTEVRFTLQSISKVISLALALMDNGENYVFDRVGMEPTGDPFHSIYRLEQSPTKPLNPMINAGALAVTNMIHGDTPDEKVGRLLSFIHELTDDHSIKYNEEVAVSEFESAFLNRALLFYMKQHQIVTGSVEETLDAYTKQCAIEVNVCQLARMGALLANGGQDIQSGRRIIPKHLARICKTFMVTCGMYDASGSFAIKVGIPAKSGVSGSVLASLNEFGGIAVYGPSLDEKGNSVVGLRLLEILSNRYDLSIF
ncbi:L-glutaminase [Halobacillus karajensis]|uniref:Glutaminase n=1 Tax=Halobacillus karajensis TaxID=195088 RepID=A0A024P2R3_9BACI|nr:glutaminase A [Halobacillus karajensis]CDQ19883.1 Glutaminase [Halobacillus karajensis]CDQ22343.1 Glutaminase [Halobacillus karajensis]CDQ28184.1 Glutaminase [Halobacillus karajensis]SEH70544.1 L-glutaminase [Halobacillus karajensis]